MNADDFKEIANAVGLPAALTLLVFYVLAKGGFLRFVLKGGDGVDDLAVLRSQMNDLNVRLTVLEDRWNRKGE